MISPHLGVSREIVCGQTSLPREMHSKPGLDYCDASRALARTPWIGPSTPRSGPAAMRCLSRDVASSNLLAVYKTNQVSRLSIIFTIDTIVSQFTPKRALSISV